MDKLRQTLRKTIHFQLMALLCLLLAACTDSNSNSNSESYPDTQQNPQTSKEKNSAPAQRIVVIDRGMNMPMAALTIPHGWNLDHDVVTNSYSGTYERFLLDIRSPDSMLIRVLGLESYNHYFNQSFDTVVGNMVRAGLQGIDGLSYGQFVEDTDATQEETFQANKQRARTANMDMQALKMPFSGNISGRNFAGSIHVTHTLFYAQGQQTGGMVFVSMLLAPEGQLPQLTALTKAINKSIEPHPDYDHARSRIIDAVTARNTAQHNQRMANQQAQFDSHQKMMQSRYAAADRQNQQWLDNFRSSGGTSTGGSYSQHERFIDTINESTSFHDTNAGGRVTASGNYDRWATDGQGNYIGSDNANFSPDALGGDWREATPLR